MTGTVIRGDVTGLTPFGSTAQTVAMAYVLYSNPRARQALRAVLDGFEEGQSCVDDCRRAGACTLADIIRLYDGPMII